RRALVEWRKELGPDGKIDAETAEEIQKSLQALGRELGPIMPARHNPASAPTTDPALTQAASDRQERWVKDVRALGAEAAGRRDAAVAAMRQALVGQDAASQLAALRVLAQTGDIKYDRSPFRPLILPI